jgi:1-acyl-sn-glycerol-3-phosphate acyltransferase
MEVVACGRPLPGYRVRVRGARGEVLPERREGLLEFQGPSATRGYYRNPAATAALIRAGWHDTGDRAYLADGEIFITGRVKDMIVRGGRNLYPYELEQAVGDLPGVRRGCVAAFAAADPRQASERLVLVAETRERDPDRRVELERAVRTRATDILGLPPDEIVLAPPGSVLKTSSGKLRRAATRDLYLSGRLQSRPPSPFMQILRVGLSGLAAAASRSLRRLPQTLYAGYAWTLFLAIGPWVWVAVATLPRPAWRWAVVRGASRLLRRLAFIGLEVEGRERIPSPGQPFVLVANHQSYLDALFLIEAVDRPLGFVAKRELASNPFARIMLSRTGNLFVDRFDLLRGADELARIVSALQRNETIAFFPEGTFHEEPGLLPFRMGAFLAAAQASVPLLPVALRGTREIMRGARFYPHLGRATLVIGPPLTAAAADWQSAVHLREEARALISRHCGDPDCTQ